MARTKRWTEKRDAGFVEVKLSSWKYFTDYVNQGLLQFSSYIFRGQASAAWKLEPTIDRLEREVHKQGNVFMRTEHLDRFKLAARGRRGSNPALITAENDWWALGQHHGLCTPLLDWTKSPYVAAYFAFIAQSSDGAAERAVWCLQHLNVLAIGNKRRPVSKDGKHREPIQFFSPLSDENARLVSQGGLFSRGPDGIDLESWIRESYEGDTRSGGILIKITIPTRDRVMALKGLNRMNINHLSLFPDLYGASKFCNVSLEINRY